jgi:hypothetical protein
MGWGVQLKCWDIFKLQRNLILEILSTIMTNCENLHAQILLLASNADMCKTIQRHLLCNQSRLSNSNFELHQPLLVSLRPREANFN